jgi:NAD(P)-dependent dehydrogenase (short-subunit alcohol dehydrogenase family)
MNTTFDMPRPFDFTGATAVVLGGATGLGLAMAEGLAAHGASVCIASRSNERARHAAATLAERFGTPCHGYGADAASEDAINRLRDHVVDLFGNRVNIAIDSAGINVRNPIDQISLAEFEAVQRVNITGAFLFARAMHPLLRAADWGRLINVASILASRSFPFRTSYAASKGAMLQLTRTLAVEWAAEKITVNAISPGWFITDMTRPVLDNQEAYRHFCSTIPMARFAEPHEIVTACLFLASPASSYVTGAEIIVDGGRMVT